MYFLFCSLINFSYSQYIFKIRLIYVACLVAAAVTAVTSFDIPYNLMSFLKKCQFSNVGLLHIIY